MSNTLLIPKQEMLFVFVGPPQFVNGWESLELKKNSGNQTSTNRGPNSRFILEEIIKTKYSTPNKGRLSSYFQITIPVELFAKAYWESLNLENKLLRITAFRERTSNATVPIVTKLNFPFI